MPTINLIIRILRLLEYQHGNFYIHRQYLDKSLSNLSKNSTKEEIRLAVDSIDDNFFNVDYENKDIIKKKIIIFINDFMQDMD